MIMGADFSWDVNELLIHVQHDLFPKGMVTLLYKFARERYLSATRLLRTQDELSRRVRERDMLDHRVLQVAHDRVAAWFRFTRPDLCQLDLFPRTDRRTGEKVSHRQKLEKEWLSFYRAECKSLAEDDAITRAILQTVAFENEDRGYTAEVGLRWLLDDRYTALTAARDEWHRLGKRRGLW